MPTRTPEFKDRHQNRGDLVHLVYNILESSIQYIQCPMYTDPGKAANNTQYFMISWENFAENKQDIDNYQYTDSGRDYEKWLSMD